MLTLQLFKIMDRIWQNEGLDLGFVLLHLQTVQCIKTTYNLEQNEKKINYPAPPPNH